MRPVDYIVLGLVASIGLTLCITAIRYAYHDHSPSVHELDILKTIVIALISIVSIYVGAAMNSEDDNK